MALRGHLGYASRDEIRGWAWETDAADTPVSVIITANGNVIGRCLANRYRGDLEKASIGDGRHGFALVLSEPLALTSRWDVVVRREGDGALLPGSPRTLEPPATFDAEAQTCFARLLESDSEDDAELDCRLNFLAEQTGKLRQALADRQSHAAMRQRRRALGWDEPDATTDLPPPKALRPLALIIDDRMPRADRDAGSNAILSHMRSLQRIGFDVWFVPATLQGDGTQPEAEGFTYCLQPHYSSVEELLLRQQGSFALVYLHRVSNAWRYGALARHYQPKARLVFSIADLHHVRLERQAAVEGRDELLAYSRWTQAMEIGATWNVDDVITHSEEEAAVLRSHASPDKIHVVPWAVTVRPVTKRFQQRSGIAFIGGYAHLPNVDAALWLVEEIMPAVWARDPNITCRLIGSDMPDSLRELESDRVEIVGHVVDLSEQLDRVRLTVAPLSYGAGLKGKVLDSLAAGIPCVCTPAAAEGFGFPAFLARQVATAPDELAKAIVALHTDEALNRTTSDAGLDFVREFANEAKIDRLLAKAVES